MTDPTRTGNPSGEHEGGLAGDLGTSSERTGPFEGIEGTGTVGTAVGNADGSVGTQHPDPDPEDPEQPDPNRVHPQQPAEGGDDETAEEQDRTSTEGVDRTATSEQNTAEVPPHRTDLDKNPGHSHG